MIFVEMHDDGSVDHNRERLGQQRDACTLVPLVFGDVEIAVGHELVDEVDLV